ncbi:hypothetical protein GCM10025331_70020 [Actinoplanes utahensis]|nr:hypothetical protein Aut01nite_75610 [Actinoplanes utahensis]
MGCIIAATVAAGSLSSPALAAPSSVDPVAEVQLRAFFDQYEVSDAVQDSLIAKMDSADRWLSLTANTKPVSERVQVSGGMKETVSTYADGSIAVSGTQIPQPEGQGGVSAQSVSGCATSSTAYSATYSNCLADVNLGIMRMYFRFNWRKTFGTSATITSFDPNSRGGHCILCSMANQRVYRINSSDVRFAAETTVAWDGSPVQITAYMGARTNLSSGAFTYHN